MQSILVLGLQLGCLGALTAAFTQSPNPFSSTAAALRSTALAAQPSDDSDLHTQLRKATASKLSAAQKKPSSFWDKLDDLAWDFLYGRKERQWNPDRRPVEMRGPYDQSRSQLSWGNNPEAEDDEQRVTAVDEAAAVETTETQEAYQQPFVMQESLDRNDPTAIALAKQMALMNAFASVPRTRAERTLMPKQLAEMCFAKYGMYHDMSIYSAQPFGKANRQVAFNIYGAALGSSQFRFTEEQYLAKLGLVCQMLNQVHLILIKH